MYRGTHTCTRVAVCCSVLQCVAVCCIRKTVNRHVQGHTHMYAETPARVATHTDECVVLQRVAVCCSVLQCVAVCCSVLQCAAVCCSWCMYGHVAIVHQGDGMRISDIQNIWYFLIFRIYDMIFSEYMIVTNFVTIVLWQMRFSFAREPYENMAFLQVGPDGLRCRWIVGCEAFRYYGGSFKRGS